MTGINEIKILVSAEASTHVGFLCPHHLLRGSASWSYLGLRKQSGSGNRSNKNARMTWQSSPRSVPIQGHIQEPRLSQHYHLRAPPPTLYCPLHLTPLSHYLISKEDIPQPPPTLFFPPSVPGSNNDSRKVAFTTFPLATPILPAAC